MGCRLCTLGQKSVTILIFHIMENDNRDVERMFITFRISDVALTLTKNQNNDNDDAENQCADNC